MNHVNIKTIPRPSQSLAGHAFAGPVYLRDFPGGSMAPCGQAPVWLHPQIRGEPCTNSRKHLFAAVCVDQVVVIYLK